MLAEQSAVLAHFTDNIREHVEHYLQTGVYFAPGIDYSDCNDYKERCRLARKQPTELSSWMLRRIIRNISREWKRPFLHATRERWKYFTGGAVTSVHKIELIVPKHKYLEPVFVPLSLVATEVNRTSRVGQSSVEVRYRPTLCKFTFFGHGGEEIFDAFLERCRTSPSHREALRLDKPYPHPANTTIRGNHAARVYDPVARQL